MKRFFGGSASKEVRRFDFEPADLQVYDDYDIGTIETCETSTLCFETTQMSDLATEEMSDVGKGQMYSTQMSSAEARQV